jgi:hypothetical chaperone protein
MIVGMDFGTTNSGMAVYDGRAVNLLPLDTSSANPRVARTSLYVTNDQAIYVGREAMDYYFQQNAGRPVRMRRVWIGELEILGADMYYVTDAYAYVDIASPGRLLLSMKSSLRDADFPGTVIGQFYYPLEDLIALYLTATRVRAERLLGQELRQVVLGRPVRFAAEPKYDALAQSRLLQAAFRAGYETVYLQNEPIAAAFSYEMTIDEEQNALVFDFGGGTLDITIMRLGDPKRREVLATGGIQVAGDVFDKKLVRTKLPHHFGEGTYYGPRHKALTVPHWIYDTFANWQTILELQATENRKILEEIAQTAQRRFQIEALISLVANNYGLPMFDIAERAKRRLSEKRGAEMLLEGPGFKVREFVTRTEFENIIRSDIRAIERHLDETVQASGLTTSQIDAVIRTGGSSQIPVFYEMLQRKFGPEKVRDIDTFSSVTAGLGIIAHGIEAGEIALRAFSQDDVVMQDAPHSRPRVSPINFSLIQRRIVADESTPVEETSEDQLGLVLLAREGRVSAAPISSHEMRPGESLSLAELDPVGDISRAVVARFDEPLLLITSRYRFLLATARQLIDLGKIGLTVTDLHQVEPYETVQTISRWDELKKCRKMLLVTSSGYTRTYPMNVFKTNVEAPVPLRFDHALPGVPVLASGAQGDEHLMVITRRGRAAHIRMRNVLTSGYQGVNVGPDDRVVGATLAQEGGEVVLITADGYGRRLSMEWVSPAAKANVKGVSTVARRSDVVAVVLSEADGTIYVVTSRQVKRINHGDLPREDSTKTKRLLKLDEGEIVQTNLLITSDEF